VTEVNPAEPEAAAGAGAGTGADTDAPLLDVDGLVKRFGGLTAVDEASFAVERGSITGLIGPNGAGKSTLFDCITGLLQPDAGVVRFDGDNSLCNGCCLPRKLANECPDINDGISWFNSDESRQFVLFEHSVPHIGT